MALQEWESIHRHIVALEEEGLVTRTFRRLDPQRQRAVVEAILEEAAARGPASLGIKGVAERAGVSVGSLYQYFGSRDGLLSFAIALCVRWVGDSFAEFTPWLAQMPLRDGLRAYLLGGLEWGELMAGLVQFLARAAYVGDPELREAVVRPVGRIMLATTRALLEAAVERGEVRADLDVEAVTRVLNATLVITGDTQLLPYLDDYYQLTDEGVPFERALDALLDVWLRGVAVEEGT